MIKKMVRFVPGVFIPMGFNFILTILYAKVLSPGEYGILNIYLNTIQILYAMTLSVFQNASLRFYSIKDSYNGKGEFVSSFVFANIFVTVLVIPVAIIINLFLKFNWQIIVLAIGVNGLYLFFCNCFRLENQACQYNLFRCVQSVGAVIILFGLSFIVNPMSFAGPLYVVYGCYGVLSIIEIIRRRAAIKITLINTQLLKDSVLYGLPLIGVSVLGYIVASCDQYFLLYYLGDEAVGNYALGHRLVDAICVNLLTMILLVMTPELNRIHDQMGTKDSTHVLKKMISGAIWTSVPISVAIIIYARPIIDFIFTEYKNAAHIMQLVVFASIFHGISMFTCKGLELAKKPKYIFYCLAAATVINCLYNAIFIPIYGIDASAHSSLIAYIMYNTLLLVITRKYYPISVDIGYAIRVGIITIITALLGIGLMIKFPIAGIDILIIQALICVVCYLALSVVLKLTNVFK